MPVKKNEWSEERVQMIDLEDGEADAGGADSDFVFGEAEFRPTVEFINERLDKYVAMQLPHLSRGYVQQLIEEGHVKVDGQVRQKKTFKMTPGEVVTVVVPEPVADRLEPEDIPLSIVYEDADVIVIDKPAGLVVHPAPGHATGTLVNGLIHYAPDVAVGGTNRPGIVHRLDKDTSGLIVVARSDRGRTTLVRQWAERAVEKRYIALVRGSVPDDSATIDVPIGRDPVQRNRMAVVPGGREAITRFTVRERFDETTLLDVSIETGRTHQIRVHMAFIGHPIVGDVVYGRPTELVGSTPRLARQFLHAASLGFALPDGTKKTFTSPLPPDLANFLSAEREHKTPT